MSLCVRYYLLKLKTFDMLVNKKFTFFLLKRVKCVYKEDVLYDNQLIITQFQFPDSTRRLM